MKTINVAVIGVGVVGSSVIDILQQNADIISARTGALIVPKIGIARTIENKKVSIPLSTNIDDALNDSEIDIVVELMGGIDIPYQIALRTLEAGKSLVTANKAMLAYHRQELEMRATHSSIGFEASVCGGIPIIKALRDGLCANHITSIRGIMNGTSNYILTQMSSHGSSFEIALSQAQQLGYAEADPTLDINGSDSAHKLLILASLAYGIHAKMEDIIVEGIEEISPEDIEFASENDYSVKLLGIAKKQENGLELRVHLCMIPKDSMLAKTDGAMNAISVVGDRVGESVYYGAGAGGNATASSVVSDIVEIVRSKTAPMLGYVAGQHGLENTLNLIPKDEIMSRYYIRLQVADKPGVLAHIADVFAINGISIQSLIQRTPKELDKQSALLLLATHTCSESQIKRALAALEKHPEVTKKPYRIRIEDL